MVSINDHPDIRRAFDGFHFECLDIRYSDKNQRQGKSEVTGELVIMNGSRLAWGSCSEEGEQGGQAARPWLRQCLNYRPIMTFCCSSSAAAPDLPCASRFDGEEKLTAGTARRWTATDRQWQRR